MTTEHSDKVAATTRTLEVITALVLFALGLVLITDSIRVGFGWSDDGPQPGYFPFYIGVFLCIASLVNFIATLRNKASATQTFLTRGQFKMVMALLIPTTVFVIAIKWLGIYLSSTLLIAWFMRRLGRYGYGKTTAVSVAVSAFLFGMFEIWFKVPLPKGPIEVMLGFA